MLSWILRKNEFYALKNAPAFVFWKNPGGHNLLLRFTDLYGLDILLKLGFSFIIVLVNKDGKSQQGSNPKV